MARLHCAISGITFNCDFLSNVSIPTEAGYFHPVFALDKPTLNSLYTSHCKGKLTATDSYLLFLAILHSSKHITWKHHVTLSPTSPSTAKLVESNMRRLVAILAKTETVSHPRFKQPTYIVRKSNSDLGQVKGWIEAWEANLEDFYSEQTGFAARLALQELENRLSYQILSGNDPKNFAGVIASWASRAGEFPEELDASYQEVIRTCFNKAKMFATPLSLIKEVADYCACNIEVGSIHFHTLAKVLQEGVKNHVDYLGGTAAVTSYTLLPTTDSLDTNAELKNVAEVAAIVSKAPTSEPMRADYLTQMDFIKAKLAYRVYQAANKSTTDSESLPNLGDI